MGTTEISRSSSDFSSFLQTDTLQKKHHRTDEDGDVLNRFSELGTRLFSVAGCRAVAFVGAGDGTSALRVALDLASQSCLDGIETIVVDSDLKLLSKSTSGSVGTVSYEEAANRISKLDEPLTLPYLISQLDVTKTRTLVYCGSIHEAAELLSVANATDGVVFVTKSGKTTVDEIARVGRLVESARAKFLGCVLEGREYAIPRLFYRKGAK